MPYFESHLPSTVELESLDKGSQSPPGHSPKTVLMIVKRGERRELVAVDVACDPSSIRSKPSKIPRCQTHSAKTVRKKMDWNEERVLRELAVLYDKQSKIPRRPVASLKERGGHQELYRACQLKPTRLPRQPNNSRLTEMLSPSPCKDRLADRLQSLDRRLDRMAGRFRHRSKELNQRLEKLHQEVDDASSIYPSFFHSFRKQWLVDWGLFVVTHVCMGFMAALRSRTAHGLSKSGSSAGIHSDQTSIVADMASLLPSEKKEQIIMCSRTLANIKLQDYSTTDHADQPEATDFGPGDELWESGSSPRSSAGDTFDQWRSDDMNNFSQENSPRQAKAKDQLDERRFSGLRKNGHRENSIEKHEAALNYKQRARWSKEDSYSVCSAHSSCNSDTDNQFAADRSCDQMTGVTGEQDAWLEAIKPEVIPAPLSHLEAESGKIPLKLLSALDDGGDLHPDSQHTRQVSTSGITGGGKKDESEFGRVLKSVENPFFGNIRADSRSECDHSLALRMPHSRPNMLYGFDSSETPQGSSPFTQFGIEELKTKWISLNDFV